MYTEEYESKGFPIRSFAIKLILVVIFVFLLIWLLPKFTSPTIETRECSTTGTCDTSEIEALTSQIFSDNLEKRQLGKNWKRENILHRWKIAKRGWTIRNNDFKWYDW